MCTGDEVIPVYSHQSTCTDCTCVVAITNDCVISFEEIHAIQSAASKQLANLVEVRERMNEVMEGVASVTSTPLADETVALGEDTASVSTSLTESFVEEDNKS